MNTLKIEQLNNELTEFHEKHRIEFLELEREFNAILNKLYMESSNEDIDLKFSSDIENIFQDFSETVMQYIERIKYINCELCANDSYVNSMIYCVQNSIFSPPDLSQIYNQSPFPQILKQKFWTYIQQRYARFFDDINGRIANFNAYYGSQAIDVRFLDKIDRLLFDRLNVFLWLRHMNFILPALCNILLRMNLTNEE